MASLNTRVTQLEEKLAMLMAPDSDDVPKPNPKAKAKPKDEEQPKKKRTSGYILFSNATRDEVRDQLTKDDEKPKNTDIMKELARLWKELSDEDKEPWNNKAKEIKDAP